MKVRFNNSPLTIFQHKGKTYYGGQIVDLPENEIEQLSDCVTDVDGNKFKIKKVKKVKEKPNFSKDKLFDLNKDEQVERLLGYGIEKKNIPRYEEDRVKLLFKLQNKEV